MSIKSMMSMKRVITTLHLRFPYPNTKWSTDRRELKKKERLSIWRSETLEISHPSLQTGLMLSELVWQRIQVLSSILPRPLIFLRSIHRQMQLHQNNQPQHKNRLFQKRRTTLPLPLMWVVNTEAPSQWPVNCNKNHRLSQVPLQWALKLISVQPRILVKAVH